MDGNLGGLLSFSTALVSATTFSPVAADNLSPIKYILGYLYFVIYLNI